MSSGLTRRRIPVRVKKTRQNNNLDHASDSIRSEAPGGAPTIHLESAAFLFHMVACP